MNEVKVLKSWTSTNRRWGVDIVTTTDYEIQEDRLPEGTVEHLGEVSRREVIKFTPKPGCGTFLCWGDITSVQGASVITSMYLQSNNNVSILLLGRVAITKWYGYKGRSCGYTLYKDGVRQDLEESQLLALGLIKSESKPKEVVPPPEIDTILAQELRKAGLI